MKKVALHNLGCKVNSYEIEVMQQKFVEKGYQIVPFGEIADIYVINTCTVTNIADRKSRQMLHRAKQLNPEALVIAVGCYVQSGEEKIKEDSSIDLAVGNNHKKEIVEIIERYLEERQKLEANSPESMQQDGSDEKLRVDKTLGGTTIYDMSQTLEYEEMQLKQTAGRTRAYIKIQDGCNQFCSYCAIPYARGRVRSRKVQDILNEITYLVGEGYKEVVLTGIHISSYGIDFGEEKKVYDGNSELISLVEAVHGIPGLERIRLGSLEPRVITAQTAKRLAALPKLCPHFHLSLQSGCDATLKRMNRRYTAGEYYTSVNCLREAFGNPAITTDVIVGFPGETEEEFRETESFVEKIRFYEMHIFKYSKREGTVAAKMPDQIPEQVKTERSNRLLEITKRQSEAFRKTYIGREAEVLLEEEITVRGKQWMVGHTKDYVKVALEKKQQNHVEENSLVKIPVNGFLTEEILM